MRVIFILAAFGALVACDRQSPSPSQAQQPQMRTGAPQMRMPAGTVVRDHKGSPLPDAPLQTLEGKPVSLRALAGRPVLVNLWATWCGPCVKEMPALARLARQRGNRLRIVPVSQDLGTANVLDWWGRQSLAPLISWHDPKGGLLEAYGAQALPLSIYYDASGRELWRIQGDLDWSASKTTRLLDEAGVKS